MEDGLTRLSGADFVSVSTDGAPEGEVVGINADTLGGYAADAYVKKTDAMVVTKNYSVVGGMDEPTIPTKNMIWVQTENAIGKVHFSGVEPNNINDNDIWIYTGNSSSVAFDAIKIGDDTMNTVYPLSAKQYVFGAWESVTPMIYQNGRWTPWIVHLYDTGNEYENVTGGWTINGYGQKEDSRIFLGKNVNYEKKDNTATTSNKLIFGGGEIVEVHGFFYSSTSASYFEVRLVDDSGTVVAKGEHTYADGNNVEVILTVTAPNGGGEFYVQVAAGQTTGDRSTYAYFNFARY